MLRSKQETNEGVLMLVSEVARELGVCAKTIRLWTENGRLPCKRTPAGFRIYTVKDINTFKEARKSA
jgi:DNA-binding transcriptional MerR regulator